MNNLKYFNDNNLFQSSIKFFNDFNIRIKSSQSLPIPKNKLFHDATIIKRLDIVKDIFMLGLLDEDVVANDTELKSSASLKDINNDLKAVVFFAVELTHNDKLPTKKALTDLSKTFNREFKHLPVVMLIKYGKFISLTHTERVAYKSKDGDKPAKVTILRDIDIENTHQGHIRILEGLEKRKTKITDFKSFYEVIQSIFNTKILNQVFYKDIFNWFEYVVENGKFPTDKKEEFTIRLITRLFFAWFIKEKNLIPEDFFDKEKVERIIDCNIEDSYYKAILQNLFFATLNQEVTKREFRKKGSDHRGIYDIYRYEKMFQDKDIFIKLTKSVPFLNGGLFQCLDEYDDNKIGRKGGIVYNRIDSFTDNHKENKLFLPNEFFFNDNKNGIIDILSSYKFTVTENTSESEEVALDPELLGRVFENLLGAYNPETRDTARKQTGSFYTPRLIVEYMVDESLKYYFKSKLENHIKDYDNIINALFSNDEIKFSSSDSKAIIKAIDECKVLDPACGSGAFIMGMLNRMVDILHKVDPENKEWKNRQLINITDATVKTEIESNFADNDLDYGRKLYLIEKCIFGVDIQSIAIQISKLRFFISLIIDQKVDENKYNFGIRPLPNLETKFVIADSLIELDFTTVKDPEIRKLVTDRREIYQAYFSARRPIDKKRYIEADKIICNKIQEIIVKKSTVDEDSVSKIITWSALKVDNKADFFSTKLMFGMEEEFDIVIGNPPYIQLQSQKITNDIKKEYSNQKFKTYVKTGDIYQLFIEASYNHARSGGIISLITSNKWLRAAYGSSTRRLLKSVTKKLIDLGGDRFEKATVDTSIIIFTKSDTSERVYNLNKDLKEYDAKTFKDDLSDLKATDNYLKIIPPNNNSAWIITNEIEKRILEKITKYGKPLKDWDVKINRGILTGYNEAFIISTEKKDELLANCKDEAERKRTAEIIHPILKGREIKRYSAEWGGDWIINTHNGISSLNMPRIVIDDYPTIKKHLDSHYKHLKKRTDQGDTPYNLRSCAYMDDFYKPKIVYPNMTKFLPFYYDEKQFFTNQKCFIIVGEDLKYLYGILNSSVSKLWILNNCPELQGGTRELSLIFMENIPIVSLTDNLVKNIVNLMDKIITNNSGESFMNEINKKINRIIYGALNLTDAEVAVLEKTYLAQ